MDFIDESEVLTPADEHFHVDKFAFKVPFVCGCRDLGEALRRIGEGAAMIRTKGEAGSGNIVEAVRHMRAVISGIRRLTTLGPEELMTEAKNLGAPYELVRWVAESGKLPVPNFSAGGIATPADAALMMQLGAEAVFVGSGIFKSADPAARAKAIVQATTHFKDPDVLAKVSEDLGEAMPGIETSKLKESDLLQTEAGSGGDPEASTQLPAEPARAGGRRRCDHPSPGSRVPAVTPGVDLRAGGGPGGARGRRARGALLLPAHRRAGKRRRPGMGRHSRRARAARPRAAGSAISTAEFAALGVARLRRQHAGRPAYQQRVRRAQPRARSSS